MTTPINIYPKK